MNGAPRDPKLEAEASVGRTTAVTGLRMKPASPSPSLTFRTASIPQYG